jgi:hypothetical protein
LYSTYSDSDSFSLAHLVIIVNILEQSYHAVASPRFEDERNDIRECYYLDAEMNRALLESYTAGVGPEPYLRSKSRSTSSYVLKPEALRNLVILNIGFYFKKETASPLIVVFWFRVSHQRYSRKGEVDRTYNADRTKSAFNSYSSQCLQSARTIVMAECDERALDTTSIKIPIDIAVFVSKIYYQILRHWSDLK